MARLSKKKNYKTFLNYSWSAYAEINSDWMK